MEGEGESPQPPPAPPVAKPKSKSLIIAAVALVAVTVLTGAGLVAYRVLGNRAKNLSSGNPIYLGPSNEQKTPTAPLRFTVSPTTSWTEITGKRYPYTLSHPTTLTLVIFPNDLTDSIAIVWGNIPPQQNLLLTVTNFNDDPTLVSYIDKPKREYIESWWKQYTGLRGVASINEFVNAKGLRVYRAKYINYANQTPNDDVFFEVPGRPELVMRMANGILDPSVFDRMVDSLSWSPATPTSLPVELESTGLPEAPTAVPTVSQ